MKLYLVDDKSTVQQCGQLLKLSAECYKLQWSRTIKDVPIEVKESLEKIEQFVEARIAENCNKATEFGVLTDEEEVALMDLIKKDEFLRSTIGSGVVYSGEQSEKVKERLNSLNENSKVIKALETEKNLIMV